MKIVVAIKQVPSRDSQLKMNSSANWIEDADLSWEINEAGCLRAGSGSATQGKGRRRGGGLVRRTGSGAAQTIGKALPKGADRAIHIETEKTSSDPLALARMMAKALESEKPDLVLTGLQSDDLGLRADRRHSGGGHGIAARDDRHEYRGGRQRHQGQARTRGRLVPERRNAVCRRC